MADTAKIIGLIKAIGEKVDPEVIKESVDSWLDDHPEAVTTVQDGSITKAKLDNNLSATVDDVGDLKSAIVTETGVEKLDKISGYYIDLSGSTADVSAPVANANYGYILARCSEGDTFTVNATGGTPAITWGFVSQTGTVLSKAIGTSHTETKTVLTAPAGSYYLVINDKGGYESYRGELLTIGIDNLKSANIGTANPKNADHQYNLITRGNVLSASPLMWEYGSIDNNTGNAGNSINTRLRSGYCAVSPNTQYKVVGTGYFQIHQYGSNKAYIGRVSTSWGSPEYTFTTNASAGYVRFLLKKDSDGTGVFDAESIANLDLVCYPATNTLDFMLSEVGKIDDIENGLEDVTEKIENLLNKDLISKFATKDTVTSNGITFTWDDAGEVCTVNGTSTGTDSDPSRTVLYKNALPSCIKASRFYRLVIESESTDVLARLRFLDSNDTAEFSTGAISETKCVFANNNVTNLELRLQVTPGATVNNKTIILRLEEIEETEYPVRLKCATYNVGCYNYGYPPSAEHPIQATSLILAEMKEYFRTRSIDLFALEEGQTVILDSDLTTETNANTALYDYLFSYNVTSNTTDKPYSPSLYSKYKMVRQGSGTMSSTRRYAWAVIDVNGILVYVLAVHLALLPADRQTNYAEIKTLVEKYDHWIVLGDFNAGNNNNWDAQPEYTALIANGWHSANGGWWGLFNTFASANESAQPRYLDTVLTSANIDINTYEAPYLYSTMPGDHRPLMCDLMIYP